MVKEKEKDRFDFTPERPIDLQPRDLLHPMTPQPSTPTTALDVTSHLQYIPETTGGSFPTSGTMTYIAPMAQVAIQYSRAVIPIGNIGTFDVRNQLAGLKSGAIIMSNMLPYNRTFMQQCINRGGTNSADQTVAMFMKANVGGTAAANQMNITMNFAKPNAITIPGMPGAPIVMEAAVLGRFPTIGTANPTSSLGTATDPSTAPWMFSDGGDTPIAIDGAYPVVGGISLTVRQNINAVYGVGPTDHLALPTGRRYIMGRISLLHTGLTYYSNVSNSTAATLAWTLKTGSGTITCYNVVFGNGQIIYDIAGDEIYEIYPFRAGSLTLS